MSLRNLIMTTEFSIRQKMFQNSWKNNFTLIYVKNFAKEEI
jgi:hypothetical protein